CDGACGLGGLASSSLTCLGIAASSDARTGRHRARPQQLNGTGDGQGVTLPMAHFLVLTKTSYPVTSRENEIGKVCFRQAKQQARAVYLRWVQNSLIFRKPVAPTPRYH
ncbi:hypothetical protein PPH41_28420, partial [Burkholderia gladioli]|nr:hypothetical protein [Burkholderia gladioli]